MQEENTSDVPAADEERLQAFGSGLAAVRDEWIRARAATGWDKRVAHDIDQYEGIDAANRMASAMMDSVEAGFPVTANQVRPHRSTLFIQVTRSRTNTSEARLADILLPTDDRNWGIQPSPDPECALAIQDDTQLIDPTTGQPVLFDKDGNITTDPSVGQPATKSAVAQATQEMASKASEAMQTEIDDQLVACDYNAEMRKVIHNAAKMGVGVVKGPMVTKRVRKAWREQVDATGQKTQVIEIVEELTPASFSVDPRMVWEDPAAGDEPKNGQGIFELQHKTARQVRDLAKQPGYIKDQLRLVLKEGPKRSTAVQETKPQSQRDRNTDDAKVFDHWIYWGELQQEDLKAAGVDLSSDGGDILQTTCGCVEMINNTVVRAYLNPLDDSPIPYDFYPWEKIHGTARGYGVPYLMRAQQSVTNGAWRQLMDNSGLCSGPQIVISQGKVTPADRNWTLSPNKMWLADNDVADVRSVFGSVEFNNHQQELQAIIEMAEKLGDQETSMPQLMAGEKGSSPDTVGGMQMLMNSASVVLRRLVKQFDDYITKPHIRRYYDYNMAYSDKDEIKGDFQVDARGTSALLIRDIQNQAITSLLGAATNPVFAPLIDARKLFEKALQAQHIDPAEIMHSEEEVAAAQKNNPPQQDPRIQAAMINAQARQSEAQAIAQGRQAETEARMNAEVQDRNLRLQELYLMRDIEILKTSSAEKISVDKIKAQLAELTINDQRTRQLAAAELANPGRNDIAGA